MNSQYCWGSDWSSPQLRWNSAIRAGVARTPRIVNAGSPGIRWTRKNTRIVTPSTTGTICARRRSV